MNIFITFITSANKYKALCIYIYYITSISIDFNMTEIIMTTFNVKISKSCWTEATIWNTNCLYIQFIVKNNIIFVYYEIK